jgi:hypothetical protein
VTNHGRTVAKVVGYTLQGDCIPKDEVTSPHTYPHESSFSSSLYVHVPANETSEMLGSIGPLRKLIPDIPGIGSGQKNGVVKVEVTYWDVVTAGSTDAKPRTQSASFMYAISTGELQRLIHFDEST